MDIDRTSGTGAQTVDRACDLLQDIARAGGEGARILDLCTGLALSRPTVHRILQSLAHARFVQQDAGTRRWRLGPALFELGMAAPSPVESLPALTHLIDELADATGDTTYLMTRRQDDVVCAWRGEGAYPIRANIVSAGDRRPMGASAAGLALLGKLQKDEVASILERSQRRLRDKCRLSMEQLGTLVAHARRQGHSLCRDLVMEGVTGVGMAVPVPAGSPYLAISVSAIGARITPQRLPQLLVQMEQCVARIASLIGPQSVVRLSPAPSARRDEAAQSR